MLRAAAKKMKISEMEEGGRIQPVFVAEWGILNIGILRVEAS